MKPSVPTGYARWEGTCEAFADVDVGELIEWVKSIPSLEWSKMVDPSWRGWGDRFRPLALDLTEKIYPGCSATIGLWTLESGEIHTAHYDPQPPEWITRVHVPIVTNPHSVVTFDDGARNLSVGKAYRFNALATHGVANCGTEPRLHFVFDIRNA